MQSRNEQSQENSNIPNVSTLLLPLRNTAEILKYFFIHCQISDISSVIPCLTSAPLQWSAQPPTQYPT